MDGVFSVEQLTSIGAVVSASIGLTWVVKRVLWNVPAANKVPVWIYTSTIAGLLAYAASRFYGTLPGDTGALVTNAVIYGAAASGIRKWVKDGPGKPLKESGTAIKAKRDSMGNFIERLLKK